MKKCLKKHGKKMIGAIIGMIAGYAYFATMGCQTGACPITSTACLPVLIGALIGALVGSIPCCSKNSCCTNSNENDSCSKDNSSEK